MKRITVLLISLTVALLLAGLCSCKQGVSSEKPGKVTTNLDQTLIEAETISEGATSATLKAGVSGVSIPVWDKQDKGYQNIPAAVTSGTGTGVSKALKAGLKNPPELKTAQNLIIMVCEGLTQELINSSKTQYGELILDSFPVQGTTKSAFSSSGKHLLDLLMYDKLKLKTGIVAYGDLASNSMRRMTTANDNSADTQTIYRTQIQRDNPLKLIVGKGDYENYIGEKTQYYLNDMVKSSGKRVHTLAEAIPLYKNNEVYFGEHGSDVYEGAVEKLYVVFENDNTIPSFRQETAFALSWIQSVNDSFGFSLILSYSPETLDANGVQDFDEAVAVAVKYVLENPDTALLICGCPADGSEADVCFFGIGKGVSKKDTFFNCVSSL